MIYHGCPVPEEEGIFMIRPRPLAAALALALVACADQSTVTALDRSAASAGSRLDASEYQVVDLGQFNDLPTLAFDIDKHGAVYGLYGTGPSARSFRWTGKDGYEDLGAFEGLPFRILSANDHGLLNGNVFDGTRQRAVAFIPRTGFVYLDGENAGTTLGNNDRGAVAGTRFGAAPASNAAFVWTQESGVALLSLAVPGATSLTSGASDVNELGHAAGTLSYRTSPTTPPINRAYMWDGTSTHIVPPLGPAAVGVTYISDDNIVIGASEMRAPVPGDVRRNPLSSNPGTIPVHAWKWSETMGLVDLGTLGGAHSVPWDVDKDGNVYGWASDEAGVQHAVKWPATGGIIKLGTLGGSSLLGGLNKHGVLAGWSTTLSGETHAMMLVPTK